MAPSEASAKEGIEFDAAGGPTMTYVYLLMSESDPNRRYLGCTEDLKSRIKDHNAGRSAQT